MSGQAGNIDGTIDARGNRFEGPRKRDYPMPPLRWTAFHEKMAAAAKGLGWHPFPGPAAINSRSYQNRSGCMYHGFCTTGGCHVDAKNSTAVTTIPRAQATGHFKVVTGAIVTSINVDSQGRATGVTYLNDGEEFFQPAKVVLLASYTYENVRLLLLSKSKAFPNGLSNNHDQVGRHYMSHHQGAPVTALFPFDINAWYGLPAQGVAIDDWADDNFDHAGLDFIGGGNLWAMSDRRPIGAAGMNTFGLAPNWGSQWKAFIKQNADRSHSSYIQKTTLPYEDNYLDLDPVVKDPLGFPVIRITARVQGERAQDRRVLAGQDGAVVPRGGRDPRQPRADRRHDGGVDARLRRHAHGRQRRDQRRQSLGHVARSAEPRRPRRVGDGHERRAQPDAHRAGAGLAHRGLRRQELEDARTERLATLGASPRTISFGESPQAKACGACLPFDDAGSWRSGGLSAACVRSMT